MIIIVKIIMLIIGINKNICNNNDNINYRRKR